MRVIGLAGWSGAGKTTLLTRLIPELGRRGVSVSTLKHAHHAFDLDTPGKDSHAHREAGAREVLISSERRWALMRELRGEAEAELPDLLARLAATAGAALASADAKPGQPPKPPAGTPAKPAAGGKGLVQIGIFSQEANAKRAVDQLKKAGISSTIRTESAKGKTFWRVVAGPASTDKTALLAKIKGLGFPDAYAVSK